MSDDTTALFKSAATNLVAIAGYISTAATFLPVMAVLRPYVRPIGVLLIVVGLFRAAQTVIQTKNTQLKHLRAANDESIRKLDAQHRAEVVALQQRVAELTRRPYSEDLQRIAEQVLDSEMTLEGRHLLRHLMVHEPIEVGRLFLPEIPEQRQSIQLAIAMQRGIVRHKESRQGALLRTYWIISPQFRPLLEYVLYEKSRL